MGKAGISDHLWEPCGSSRSSSASTLTPVVGGLWALQACQGWWSQLPVPQTRAWRKAPLAGQGGWPQPVVLLLSSVLINLGLTGFSSGFVF